MAAKKTSTALEAAETIAADCLVARIRLLHRTITSIYDELLRPLGLTSGQLNILVMVANRGSVSPGSVARRMKMDKSTVSRNIARMDKSGWLELSATETGRTLSLTLSPKGKALLVEALPVWKQAQTKAQAALGQRGAKSIRALGNTLSSRAARN